jgi:hypothetical protein
MHIVAIIVLYPGCAYSEVATAYALLSEFGTVLLAGPTREPVTTERDLTLVPHISYAQAAQANPSFLIVPGGDFSSLIGNIEMADLVKRYKEQQSWFCSIGMGTAALAQYGVFDGKQVTHTCTASHLRTNPNPQLLAQTAPWLSLARHVEENVVADRFAITAKPWATVEFAVTIAIVGGFLDKEAAIKRSDYLFGKPSLNSN